MTQISFGVSNSTVLMKSCASAPMTAAGRKAIRMPSDEAARRGSLRQIGKRSSSSRAE